MTGHALTSNLGVIGTIAAMAATPARAAEGDPSNVMVGLSAGLAVAVLVAATIGFLLLRSREQVAAARRSIDAAPAGLVRWSNTKAQFSGPAAHALSLAESSLTAPAAEADRLLVSAMHKDDKARLKAAVAALHEAGTEFEERVRTADDRSLLMQGRRLDRTDILWITDVSEAAGVSSRLAASTDEAATLRAVLDILPLPIWWRDETLALGGCNRAYAEASDADPDTVVKAGRELGAGYIDQDGRALAKRAVQTRMAQTESHHVVIGGRRRLLEFTETPVGGGGTGVAGFATDATALEALQDQLADHIAAHADVLEGLNTGIGIFGADRRLKFFNTAYAGVTGIDPETLQGEPTMGEILEWMRERRRLPEYADFPAFKADRDRWFTSLIDPLEELVHLPDQTTIRSVASPHPLGGLVFAMEDVTDRLALESSYNTLIAVQRETLNNLHEAVAVFGGDGRLKLFNSELARLWKLSEDQLDGNPHANELIELSRDYFPEDTDWRRLKERLILMVTERPIRSGRLRRTDDSVLKYGVVPLPDGNTLISFLDVSDSAQVERALRERNIALENADRIKSEFIGNVSYELRTPLNAIVGFTEILDNRYFGELSERQAEYVECILQASNHLMALIDDILDLATIEAGYMALDLQPLDIHELMTGIADVASARADQAGLSIEIDCPKKIGTLTADAVRLRQALFNLVSNAIQFTPVGGVITLSARRTSAEIQISVSDTGIGIAPEDQTRVFERFERGDPNARASGTGLGLALVKSLVELHGGSVELDSTPGSGTRATCRLPIGGAPKQIAQVGDQESAA